MAAEIDWDEIGTLRCSFGEDYGYEIGTGPLWTLVITARQGHEPALESLSIKMTGGAHYGPDEIEALGHRPDRKGRP